VCVLIENEDLASHRHNFPGIENCEPGEHLFYFMAAHFFFKRAYVLAMIQSESSKSQLSFEH
jgi:hypothetical protein